MALIYGHHENRTRAALCGVHKLLDSITHARGPNVKDMCPSVTYAARRPLKPDRKIFPPLSALHSSTLRWDAFKRGSNNLLASKGIERYTAAALLFANSGHLYMKP
eukprot:scaffold149299_cov32-Prasinocladus_malaysianus.AAC.2